MNKELIEKRITLIRKWISICENEINVFDNSELYKERSNIKREELNELNLLLDHYIKCLIIPTYGDMNKYYPKIVKNSMYGKIATYKGGKTNE